MQIVCNHVQVGYGQSVVCKDISFIMQDASYTCIVGENGSGKTTFVKTILGLLPVLAGDISYGEHFSSKDLGYLPQHSQNQKDFPASVYEVVLSGCLSRVGLRPFYTKKEKQRAKEMIARFHLTSFTKKSYQELSGGQQRRVLLARALCAGSKLLVLDEPVAGLDEVSIRDFYQDIKQLHKEGMGILMITHSIQEVVQDCEYVLHFSNQSAEYVSSETYRKELGL